MRILIIEDSSEMRFLHRRTFKGHDIEEAETFAEGLRKAQQLSPDVIITDLRLSDQSERDTAERVAVLRQFSRAVIVASGHFDKEIAEIALRAGATAFIDKDERLTARLIDAVEAIGSGPSIADVLRIAKEIEEQK
jgi:DNA-binding NarL/FixJ family response regulator